MEEGPGWWCALGYDGWPPMTPASQAFRTLRFGPTTIPILPPSRRKGFLSPFAWVRGSVPQSAFSISVVTSESSGSVRGPKARMASPFLPIRILWKFHTGSAGSPSSPLAHW